VWFRWDGANILLSMAKVRQKYRNLRREPRIALAIVDPATPYRSLEIRGRVARIEEDPLYQLSNSLSQKYLGRDVAPEEKRPGEERVMIVVEPERVFLFPPQQDSKPPESPAAGPAHSDMS
jgi:PPOX class probable F420-dependent enzyme